VILDRLWASSFVYEVLRSTSFKRDRCPSGVENAPVSASSADMQQIFSARAEHVSEVADILATGLQRLLERKSSQILRREAKTPLDRGRECAGDVARKSEDIAQ
jgi:hypothetical protein